MWTTDYKIVIEHGSIDGIDNERHFRCRTSYSPQLAYHSANPRHTRENECANWKLGVGGSASCHSAVTPATCEDKDTVYLQNSYWQEEHDKGRTAFKIKCRTMKLKLERTNRSALSKLAWQPQTDKVSDMGGGLWYCHGNEYLKMVDGTD
uniref:Ricin B-type lectin domain-containing protein n=1 Tax=Panagrellus redivivus TaxID=6233 RepID=A0A7E4W949_PANRE